jgi:hypothetical protein
MKSCSLFRLATSAIVFALASVPIAKADGFGEQDLSGLRDVVTIEAINHFKEDTKIAAAMSIKERQDYLKKHRTEMSGGLLKILTAGAENEEFSRWLQNSEAELKKFEESARNSSSSLKIQIRRLNPIAAEILKEYLTTSRSGVSAQIIGSEGSEFILVVKYWPDNADAKHLKITSLAITGAELVQPEVLKKDVEVAPFSSLSQACRRTGTDVVHVAVGFDGIAYPVIAKLLPLPPPPTPAENALKSWQGRWVACDGDLELVFAEGRFTWTYNKAAITYSGKLSVVEIKGAFTSADVFMDAGPMKGHLLKAIFRCDDDGLHYCGSYCRRPVAFKQAPEEQHFYVLWQRPEK